MTSSKTSSRRESNQSNRARDELATAGSSVKDSLRQTATSSCRRSVLSNLSSKYPMHLPYKVMITEGDRTKRPQFFPPSSGPRCYWAKQSSFTQSVRLTALDPYGDQNHLDYLRHSPDPRASHPCARCPAAHLASRVNFHFQFHRGTVLIPVEAIHVCKVPCCLRLVFASIFY